MRWVRVAKKAMVKTGLQELHKNMSVFAPEGPPAVVATFFANTHRNVCFAEDHPVMLSGETFTTCLPSRWQ